MALDIMADWVLTITYTAWYVLLEQPQQSMAHWGIEVLETGSPSGLLRWRYSRQRSSHRRVAHPTHFSLLVQGEVAANNIKDHCVEDIRQALMCQADTSIITYNWRPNSRRPWPNFSVDRTCVDWDALDSWAAQRSFSLYDQKSLVHPEFGKSRPLVWCSLTGQLTPHGNLIRNRLSNHQRVDRRDYAWARNAHCMAGSP